MYKIKLLLVMPKCFGRPCTREEFCSCKCAQALAKKFNRLPSRLICLAIIIFQSIVLNSYMIAYDKVGYAWILADGLVMAIFVASLVVSFKQLRHENNQQRNHGGRFSLRNFIGDMPLGFMAWAIYALVLVTRVAVIFKYINEKPQAETGLFGPNMLKTAIGLSAVIYVLHIMAHHDVSPHTEAKYYLDHIATGITLDILDTVDILTSMFDDTKLQLCRETGPSQAPVVDLPSALVDTIVGAASINLLLPTVPLILVSRGRATGGSGQRSIILHALQPLFYMLLVNVPFLVLRSVMWYMYKRRISVFLVKNIVRTIISLHDLVDNIHEIYSHSHSPEKNGGEAAEPETATSDAMDIIELDDSPHANDVRDIKLKQVMQAQIEAEKTGLHVTAL